MTKTLQLKLTSPSSEFPYQKGFPAETPLVEFKRRIELIVGIYSADMSLSLLNEDQKFVCELRQEGQTLEELGVRDNYTIKVDDRSGRYVDPLSGNVEHYKINDANYQQREDNFLNFKKRNLPPFVVVGNRCTVTSKMKGNRSGMIAYVGEVDFKPEELMIGITLDEPLGKHDGSVDGKRYFQCKPLHGIFVDRKFVNPEIQGELKMPVEGKEIGDTEMIEEL